MSKQPAKKSPFQTIITMTVLYLGFLLIFQTFNKPSAPTVVDLAKLQDLNGRVQDLTIAQELPHYKSSLDEDVKKGKLTAADAEKLYLQAEVLVADTQYKGGMRLDDYNRLTLAYQVLHDKKKDLQRTGLWDAQVAVTPTPKLVYVKDGQVIDRDPNGQFKADSVIPSVFYETIHSTLSKMLKEQPVVGLIPGYQEMDFLVHLTGANPSFSYALAALLLALCVRGVVYPLAQKQLMWSRQMSQLTPLVNELKAKFGSDQQELQVKIMALYKEYGINPYAGCGPMLLQMPLFLIIYQCMVHYRFEFTKGLFLWVNPAVAATTNGLTAPNLGERDYVLLSIYLVSMVVTTFLTPVSDPANFKQQRMMGVGMSLFFGIMMFFWVVPSAFVLYWIFTNVIATTQSLRAYRLPLPPLVKVNGPNGTVLPAEGIPTLNGRSQSTGVPQTHKPKKKKK